MLANECDRQQMFETIFETTFFCFRSTYALLVGHFGAGGLWFQPIRQSIHLEKNLRGHPFKLCASVWRISTECRRRIKSRTVIAIDWRSGGSRRSFLTAPAHFNICQFWCRRTNTTFVKTTTQWVITAPRHVVIANCTFSSHPSPVFRNFSATCYYCAKLKQKWTRLEMYQIEGS